MLSSAGQTAPGKRDGEAVRPSFTEATGRIEDLELAELDTRLDPAALAELMDEPCSPEALRACLRDLELVNRLSFGYRPTLDFLQQVAAGPDRSAPLDIVDVGAGGGDTLRRIARWARRRGVAVTLTGIDLNPLATQIAREAASGRRDEVSPIRWITGDFTEFLPEHPPDVILSSLMTHHLTDTEIVRFLRWMETHARIGWFINDLARSRRSEAAFGLLARVLRLHRFVQHDGPLSFRRAFVEEDWQTLLAAAEVPENRIVLERWRPSRLCVTRLRDGVKAT